MSRYYYLDEEHRPVRARSMEEWAEHFGYDDHRGIVEQTATATCWVSTVFLGTDHRFWGEGPPLLFETMVFGKEREMVETFGRMHSMRPSTDVQRRYSSWDDAQTGHDAEVSKILRLEAEALEKLK